MSKKKSIVVEGTEIMLVPGSQSEDYISLTDIMKRFDDEYAIYSWMRNKNTVEFLGVWEQLNNPDFKGNEFVTFKNAAGSNSFNLTPQKWIKATNAVGMTIKAGRYGGGTFAHRDIAVNFCYWLSPTFQLYLIKEFQRLKTDESARLGLDWNLKRQLAKANWHIHTEAVREHLVPIIDWNTRREAYAQANEADLLNLALFGMTARDWKLANPDASGNLRDHASTEHLLVLANLQSLNAKLLEWDTPKDQRLEILNKTAREQMEVLINSKALSKLQQLGQGPA